MMSVIHREAEMRTTVTIDDALWAQAAELSGITERSALVREGLATLVRVESARRLAALGGTDPKAKAAPRRRGSAA
jgi:Arc/MetJ family transcription regulator